jgi:hypothetical protein
MALKLTRNSDTWWIDIEGSKFLVRALSLSEENKLRQNNTKVKRGMEVEDRVQIFKDRFDRVVQDWDNVEVYGDPFPECNRANKDWICEQFTNVATEILARANEEGQDVREVENENLSDTSTTASREG